MEKTKQKKWWETALWVIGSLAWVFFALIFSQLFFGLIIAFVAPQDFFDSPINNALFSVLSYSLTLVLTIFVPPKIFKKIKKPTRESLGLRGLPTWTDIGLAPIGYVATILLAMGLTAVFSLMPWFDADQVQDLGYNSYLVGFERGLVFIELAVIAPIVEEVIFRGYLYGKLRVKIPKWLAIILTSLLFGLIHFQWNVGVTVFCMSVITCTFREVTGSIYAGILVHMINNGIAFYLTYVAGMM